MPYNLVRLGTETRINTTKEGAQFAPLFSEVTVLADGRVVATWTGNGTQLGQEDDFGVFQQVFGPSGNKIGGEIRVNTTSTGEEFWDGVTFDLSDGKWATTWTSTDPVSGLSNNFLQIFDANGRVGGEVQVNTADGVGSSVQSTTLPGGDFVLTWHGQSTQPGQEDTSGIFYQRFHADGTKVGGETRVNTSTDGDQLPFTLTQLGNGFAVMWRGSGTQPGQADDTGLFLQLFDEDWTPIGGEILVNTFVTGRFESFSGYTQLSNGGFVITYRASAGATTEAFQQVFDANGTKRGGEIKLPVDTASSSLSPRAYALADGKWMTFWHEGLVLDPRDLYYQVYDANGAKVGGKMPATESTEGEQIRTQILSLKDGGLVLVWRGKGTVAGQDDADGGYFFQRFNAQGAKVGGETRINTSKDGVVENLSLTELPGGQFVAVWAGKSTVSGQEDTKGIFQQIFDANFNRIGGETRVATSVTGDQISPTATASPDGSWYVTWMGNGEVAGQEDPYDDSTGEGGGFFFQHFLLNAAPTAIALKGSIREDAKASAVAGTLSAVDVDKGDTFTYRLIDGAGGDASHPLFKLDGNLIRLKLGSTLDYEKARSHTLHIEVKDSNGGTYVQDVTVTVTNLLEKTPLKLRGTAGNDTLYGELGNDTLSGGAGNDLLAGDLGQDYMATGTGKDIVMFNTRPISANRDKVADFDPRLDSIYLDNAFFPKLGKAGTLQKPVKLNKAFFAYDAPKDANDYLIYNRKTGVLSYDADGSGAGKAVDIAVFTNKAKITLADFFVI
ncbi:hypothetical protein [Microvirga terricola]|uniref:Cadherin domain-containing protein n=1 Tax=Microvirga terricola TaxID=2719797 RepID=A0ABX0V8Z2_9HYPH|nr:hypothetical protein [Microvirga terricola]NIX76313.1 hypothetical protein [Microvirga terricola]